MPITYHGFLLKRQQFSPQLMSRIQERYGNLYVMKLDMFLMLSLFSIDLWLIFLNQFASCSLTEVMGKNLGHTRGDCLKNPTNSKNITFYKQAFKTEKIISSEDIFLIILTSSISAVRMCRAMPKFKTSMLMGERVPHAQMSTGR